MLSERFMQLIDVYSTNWNHEISPQITQKTTPYFIQIFRFFRLKRQLNKVCKNLLVSSSLALEDLKQNVAVSHLISMWLDMDTEKWMNQLKPHLEKAFFEPVQHPYHHDPIN